MMVSDKASSRQRSERKESSVGGSRDREGGNGKEPKIRRESFRSSEERVGKEGVSKRDTEVEVKMA